VQSSLATEGIMTRRPPSPAILADVVELANVGMIDAGRGARFAPETTAGGGIRLAADHLDGDAPTEAVVVRGVHHSHPALAQTLEQAEVPDLLPHGESI
jgi:hypothetical protein